MFLSRRSLVCFSALVMSASVALAGPARADGSFTVSTNGALWVQGGYVPTLPYGEPISVSTGSRLTIPMPVTIATAGNCTTQSVSDGSAIRVTITGTATSGFCTVTASTQFETATYQLPLAMGNQRAALGKAFNPNGMLAPGKKYLMGAVGLKTDQGNQVTFGVSSNKRFCKMVTKNQKVYLMTTKNSANKSCTVTATAPTTSANYSALNTVNTLGIFK